METRIMPCTCKHDFQDKTYGKGMRVHNRGGGIKSGVTFICTVCSNKKNK